MSVSYLTLPPLPLSRSLSGRKSPFRLFLEDCACLWTTVSANWSNPSWILKTATLHSSLQRYFGTSWHSHANLFSYPRFLRVCYSLWPCPYRSSSSYPWTSDCSSIQKRTTPPPRYPATKRTLLWEPGHSSHFSTVLVSYIVGFQSLSTFSPCCTCEWRMFARDLSLSLAYVWNFTLEDGKASLLPSWQTWPRF